MAVGLGLSIGTVNSVSAVAVEGSAKAPPGRRPAGARGRSAPQGVTRRTTLTFDSTGSARVGVIPRHGRAVVEFADLSERPLTRARVAHRALSPANLVATVAHCLIREVLRDRPAREETIGVVLTHPARYSGEQVRELRAALDAAGLDQVVLAAEPIAAVTWLEADRGPLTPGLALVYDLGGAGLDVTLVRVGPGCPSTRIVGKSLRAGDFGGRALAARTALGSPRPADDAAVGELRAEHVRDSLEVVYRCLRVADVTMADVDCVLVVGGAARPAEVAEVLAAELARPVITAPDPERTIAAGAAIIARQRAAARTPAARGVSGRGRRGAATRARLLTRRTRRRLARASGAATLSLTCLGMALLVPGDGVMAALPR